jgi:hypothetical protein
MATVSIGRHPDLTADAAIEVFQRHFAGKYEVSKTSVVARDFIVKKSGTTGVGVRLKQGKDGAEFVFTGMIPGLWQRFVYSGLAGYLFLRPAWRALEAEIASFIENEPSFRDGRAQEERAA